MIRLITAAILTALSVGAHAADTPAKSCALTRYASLPIQTQPDGRFAIPVKVMGHDASFLVDTGGVSATMTKELAKDIGLDPKPTNRWLDGVGGSVLYSFVYAKSFSIGRLAGAEIPVYIDPRISGLGLDGTLSPDMMSHFDVDIDFANSTLNLFSPDHCPGKAVYWTQTPFLTVDMAVAVNSGHIQIPATVDGKSVTAFLDTGARFSTMNLAAAKLLGIDEKSTGMKLKHAYGQNGVFKEFTYPFKSLDLGGISVTNPHITIMSNEALFGSRPQMIIGIGIMRRLHMYIAYKERKLYITPATAN